MQALNTTNNITATIAALFVTNGISHIILVIIPCLILGPIVVSILISSFRRDKSSSSLMFIFISIVCTVAPSAYGTLIDVSLITGFPVFGECSDEYARSVVFSSIGMVHSILLVLTAFYSVQQYMIIRGFKRNMVGLSVVLLLISLIVGLLVASTQFIDDVFAEGSQEIRGSICVESSPKRRSVVFGVGALLAVVIFIPSVVIVVVFTILSYKYIKKNIIEDAVVSKSVQRIFLYTIVAAIVFRIIPVIGTLTPFILTDMNANIVVGWTTSYAVDLSYPLYLLLIISVHKSTKEEFKKLLVSYVTKRHNRVAQA